MRGLNTLNDKIAPLMETDVTKIFQNNNLNEKCRVVVLVLSNKMDIPAQIQFITEENGFRIGPNFISLN